MVGQFLSIGKCFNYSNFLIYFIDWEIVKTDGLRCGWEMDSSFIVLLGSSSCLLRLTCLPLSCKLITYILTHAPGEVFNVVALEH